MKPRILRCGIAAPFGNGTFNVTPIVTGPAGWTVTVSPASLTFVTPGGSPSNHTAPQSWTVSVQVPASGVTPGPYAVVVKANPSITGVGQGPGSTFTVNVKAPQAVDNVAPTTSRTVVSGGNPYVSDTWTNDDVTITLSATDTATPPTAPSGVDKIYYSLKDIDTNLYYDLLGNESAVPFSPPLVYTGPITLSAERRTLVGYYAVDNAGLLRRLCAGDCVRLCRGDRTRVEPCPLQQDSAQDQPASAEAGPGRPPRGT